MKGITLERKEQMLEEMKTFLKNGTPYADILSPMCLKYDFTKRTFDVYWRTAKERLAEERQKQIKVREKLEAEAIKRDIMKVDERKEILTLLIRGKRLVKKPFIMGGRLKLIEIPPDYTEIRSMISELNKMEGDYAPIKTDNTERTIIVKRKPA